EAQRVNPLHPDDIALAETCLGSDLTDPPSAGSAAEQSTKALKDCPLGPQKLVVLEHQRVDHGFITHETEALRNEGGCILLKLPAHQDREDRRDQIIQSEPQEADDDGTEHREEVRRPQDVQV